MYAASPYWRFEAERPARKSVVRLRKAAIAVGMTILIAFALARTAVGEGPTGLVSYRVQPGDTLWSIAAARYPDSDVRQKVGDIERDNGLSSPMIVPGEVLRLPAG
ncbi:MAG TPA: LysM peptidoglycan-binding domain-containing protein [Candidatus Dormibacteraeota bacterium]